MNEVAVKEKPKSTAAALLEANVPNSYIAAAIKFVNYVKEGNKALTWATVQDYVTFLRSVQPDGKRYSVSTVNLYITAMRQTVMATLDTLPITNKERATIAMSLQGIKHGKVDNAVGPDDYPTQAEVEKLIRECTDKRIKLVIEFLWRTGTRISEALGVLKTDVALNHTHVRIRILGKGNKERIIMISKDLYERIDQVFRGGNYLFGHGGNPYNRNAITQRIKYQSLKILGKEFSAHKFRHAFARFFIARKGVQKTSLYLGHADAGSTLNMYGRAKMSFEDTQEQGE